MGYTFSLSNHRFCHPVKSFNANYALQKYHFSLRKVLPVFIKVSQPHKRTVITIAHQIFICISLVFFWDFFVLCCTKSLNQGVFMFDIVTVDKAKLSWSSLLCHACTVIQTIMSIHFSEPLFWLYNAFGWVFLLWMLGNQPNDHLAWRTWNDSVRVTMHYLIYSVTCRC